jgi:hypothetical protein
VVPTKNLVFTTLPGASYGGQDQLAWTSLQDWRSRLRSTDTGVRGVGFLVQSPALDAVAATLLGHPAQRIDAGVLLAAAGYPVSVLLTASVEGLPIAPGTLCVKRLFGSLPGVEWLTSGVRAVGIAVPESNLGECVVVAGVSAAADWQLPPTGSTSVYPFPGKIQTLTGYSGDPALLGLASDAQLGHIVFVSVASVDALPINVPGAGTGQAIAPAQVTLERFTLRVKATQALQAAKVLIYPGVGRASGVQAEASSALRFPTSLVLVPEVPLPANTVLSASFQAMVNGRRVYRDWDFTTGD